MSVPSFVAGWICAWGAIVVAGVIGGLVLRATRSRPTGIRVQLEAPRNVVLLNTRRPA